MSPTDSARSELLTHRERLDELNLQLLRLLEERGRVVAAVMALKQAHGLVRHDPEREQTMLNGLCAQSNGPYTSAQIVRLFNCIFEVSRSLGETEG